MQMTFSRLRLTSLWTLAGVLAATAAANAQDPPVHYLQSADQPPGLVGSRQLLRGGPLAGYFQPVEVRAPQGAAIALAIPGGFTESKPEPARAAMLIGKVYRLKVTGIPDYEGEELFPTIEVINRLYPPCGHEAKFPIPVDLAIQDLELALRGSFVTRVIYLENPDEAFPVVEDPERQRYFDVHPEDDPLQVADRLGRPMAIVRIGSRQPESDGPSDTFLYGAPPWKKLPPPPPRPNPAVEPIVHGKNIPRVPLERPRPSRPPRQPGAVAQ